MISISRVSNQEMQNRQEIITASGYEANLYSSNFLPRFSKHVFKNI